jgi:mono/diheme cytochrome c family protein
MHKEPKAGHTKMLIGHEKTRACCFAFLGGAILLLASVVSAMAQDLGDAAAGHRLAETWCASCHVIDRVAKSGTSTGAPPFPAVARMASVTPLSLRVFLQTPHQRMPDLHLSREEIDDVIAYILSMRDQ